MLSSEELKELRNKIDLIDLNLLQQLSERLNISRVVGSHKIETNIETRDLDRERELIKQKISLAKKLGLNEHFINEVFQLIIDNSVRTQYNMKNEVNRGKQRVAYLGDQGSYSHQALLKYFGNREQSISPFGYLSFKDIVHAVQNGEMDIGLLPIENTTSGAILEVYDLLQSSGIKIVGEEIIPVKHCLIGNKSANKDSIKQVLGHPQAITQCSELLSMNKKWNINYSTSSAEALEKIISSESNELAAIANEFAAELYGLKILESNIANYVNNYTRFILIANGESIPAEDQSSKISIVFTTGQEAGALMNVLGELKKRNIVLTKLQSRPIPEMPWQEMFYADIKGHVNNPQVKECIEESRKHCKYLKVLGCYPDSYLEKAIVS